MDISYEEQLKLKQKYIDGLLKDIGKPMPIMGMDAPKHYRNKVNRELCVDRKGHLHCGCYESGSHRVVDVEHCIIENSDSQNIIETITQLIYSFKIRIYDEDRGIGLLRHILVRKGFATGQIMVVLVVTSPVFPSKNNFVKALRKVHPDISTVVLNINDKNTSMVLGERNIPIYGPGYIKDRLCGLEFKLSPTSFYQVNPVQTEKLYETALEFAGLNKEMTVIDAYCGIGTIGLCAAAKAGRVIGVELNREAIKDAKANATANHIENVSFYNRDAGEFMKDMAAKKVKADVVIMDPPRSGSSREFMDSVAMLSPARVVYVSCGPQSLANDLKYMIKKGYRVEKIQPVDMFPYTNHVETVCLLSKLSEAKHSIDVKLDMDELDVTSAETKATYEEIKAYVLEQTGLQVSSLYIAQVKRECGIIERENYKKPKAEDANQPQCPEDKRKAIKEALIHFGMI